MNDDQEPREPAPRPQPYPLDEALEQAYAPDHSDEQVQGWTIPHVGHTDDREAEDSRAQTTGAYAQAETHGEDAQRESDAPALVTGDSVDISLGDAHACEIEPQTLQQTLSGLPEWQVRYVLHLMDLGGVIALACRRTNVSRQSVEEAQAASPAFLRACVMAVQDSTDLVEGAIFRGATIGDLEPVYQGGLLVGHKRKRNTKDAELFLRLRGRLQEGNETAKGVASAIHATAEALPGAVAGVLERLYSSNRGRPQVIEAEVIEPK